MKIHVDIDKKEEDCFQVIVMILDTEEIYSNRLFRSPLDYPTFEGWAFVENRENVDHIENIFSTFGEAEKWAASEIKALKNKLCL